MNIAQGLHGAKVLNEFRNGEAQINVPELEALGSSAYESVQQFMSLLFINNVTEYATASLIMYHKLVTKETRPVQCPYNKVKKHSDRSTYI
jgi:hypothetical protein